MRVVKVRTGRDWRFLPGGEEIVVCPHCRARWLTRLEGSADQGSCPHLRFTWYAGVYGGRPEYAEGWHPADFERQVRFRYRRLTGSDGGEPDSVPMMYDPALLRRILRPIVVAAIDEALYLPFPESGPGACGEAAIFWGFAHDETTDTSL